MIKWSFSGLKQYINCPYQYQQVKVLQRYATAESPQIKFGKEVHKVLEDYVRLKTEIPKDYRRFKSLVDVLLEIPGDKYVEHEMALTYDKLPCEFTSPDYWVRGIADLLIVDDDTAFVVDYKTGSNKYPDPKQLKLMALMIFAHFPTVQCVKGGLLFVVHNSFMPEEFLRSKADSYWSEFAIDLTRLEMSVEKNWWPMNPTGLCKWCPVDHCEFKRY